jgi:hypothetical protein
MDSANHNFISTAPKVSLCFKKYSILPELPLIIINMHPFHQAKAPLWAHRGTQ